jgi:6-pyruvoyltetrahydropterin/6-carboxytetrahydropterin synthase
MLRPGGFEAMKGLALRLTRRYRFAASHRLHSRELSQAENALLYGKCNNPYGHGHDYILEVTVRGRVDRETGVLIPLQELDDLVESRVLKLFRNRNINMDVPQFRELVPTTENVALIIARLLEAGWGDVFPGTEAHLDRVHIQETDRNGFEVVLGDSVEDKEKARLSGVASLRNS